MLLPVHVPSVCGFILAFLDCFPIVSRVELGNISADCSARAALGQGYVNGTVYQ